MLNYIKRIRIKSGGVCWRKNEAFNLGGGGKQNLQILGNNKIVYNNIGVVGGIN